MLTASAPVTAPRAFTNAALPGRSGNRAVRSRQQRLVCRADNVALSLLSSAAAGSIVAGVTLATAPDRDAEIERIQTIQGAAPLAAAVVGDAVAHSIPGLNILLALLSEPVGAAAGVAYMMSILVSASAIDPDTLAPKGTVLNAEVAKDNSGALRQRFTRILPIALQVRLGKAGAGNGGVRLGG